MKAKRILIALAMLAGIATNARADTPWVKEVKELYKEVKQSVKLAGDKDDHTWFCMKVDDNFYRKKPPYEVGRTSLLFYYTIDEEALFQHLHYIVEKWYNNDFTLSRVTEYLIRDGVCAYVKTNIIEGDVSELYIADDGSSLFFLNGNPTPEQGYMEMEKTSVETYMQIFGTLHAAG